MTTPVSNLSVLLSTISPALNDGVYVYSSVAHGSDISHLPVIATMREAEGLTVVVAEDVAVSEGLPVLFRCAWITLTVHSDLQAVGLTAAFAKALGDRAISCNVIAGAYHDHIFVPFEASANAMSALQQLQRSHIA
jgi:hypothetical protein